MNDDPGVIGRLPRSRPGTRSEKRVADTPARAAEASERRVTKASKPAKAKPAASAKTAPKARAAATPKARAATPPKPGRPPKVERPSHAAPPQARRRDPLTDAVRAGVRVAEGGFKLATGLTRELLRRVPRP